MSKLAKATELLDKLFIVGDTVECLLNDKTYTVLEVRNCKCGIQVINVTGKSSGAGLFLCGCGEKIQTDCFLTYSKHFKII